MKKLWKLFGLTNVDELLSHSKDAMNTDLVNEIMFMIDLRPDKRKALINNLLIIVTIMVKY